MKRLPLLLCILLASLLTSCTQTSESDTQPSLPESDSPTQRQPSTDDADITPDAFDLVERVVLAHGGRENFKKTRIGKSHLNLNGVPGLPAGSTADVKEYFDLPSRFRRDVNATVAGESIAFSYVITERGSWQRIGERDWMPNPDSPSNTPKTFPSSIFDKLLTIAESPEDLTVSLATTPQGKTLFVLRHEFDGHWNSDLHIDPTTYLMFSSTHPVYSLATEDFVETNTFYKDYKTIDGVVVPMTTEAFQNGKLILRNFAKEISFLDTLDESAFAMD
ncbi:MAG: hypothetical protein AAF483_17730 [Planctomycetota bacterium]